MEHRHIYDRMKEDPVFGVIGGGSWATALVKLLSENGRRLNWYMRDKSISRSITTIPSTSHQWNWTLTASRLPTT